MSISLVAAFFQSSSFTSSDNNSTGVQSSSQGTNFSAILENVYSNTQALPVSTSQSNDNAYGFSAADGSVQGQLIANGQSWCPISAPITAGSYVQDTLAGRLNQPAGRGDIGEVVSVSQGAAQVDFGRGYVVGINLSELSGVSLSPAVGNTPIQLSGDVGITGKDNGPEADGLAHYSISGELGTGSNEENFNLAGDVEPGQFRAMTSDYDQVLNDIYDAAPASPQQTLTDVASLESLSRNVDFSIKPYTNTVNTIANDNSSDSSGSSILSQIEKLLSDIDQDLSNGTAARTTSLDLNISV